MARKREGQLPEPTVKSAQMLYSLTRSQAALHRLLSLEDKPYAPLAAALRAWVGRPEVPTAKGLQEQLGITPPLLRQWLEGCYAALLELLATDTQVLQVREIIHCLYLHGKRKTVEVRCQLPVTPRLYEQVEIPLLKAETGEYTYYVEGITYELELDQLLIHVSLKAGHYKAYVARLRERAYFEGKITLQDLLSLSGVEMEERLRALYGRG